jgi:hypothetical protein
MVRALRWSASFFVGFLIVTQQVMTNGPLINIDTSISQATRPHLAHWFDFGLRKIDNLGLRGLTATILLIAAVLLSYQFAGTQRGCRCCQISDWSHQTASQYRPHSCWRTFIPEWPCIERAFDVGNTCLSDLSVYPPSSLSWSHVGHISRHDHARSMSGFPLSPDSLVLRPTWWPFHWGFALGTNHRD